MSKALLSRIEKGGAVEGAGDRDDDAGRRHVGIAEGVQRIDADVRERRVFAQDRTTKWLAGVERALVQFEDTIVRLIEGFAALLGNDALLFFQIVRRPVRCEENVGYEVERERRGFSDDARVVRCALVAGGGVHHAAGVFDGFSELARVTRAGALEGHMLEQMRDAVEFGGLPARADALPYAKRCRAEARHRIERDTHAVRQADKI